MTMLSPEVMTPQGWQRLQLDFDAPIVLASGTIDALGNVTLTSKSPNVKDVTAAGVPPAPVGTLTIDFNAPIDEDGIYFAIAYVYQPGSATAIFTPTTQTTLQTVFSQTYPNVGPWNFSILAIGDLP
jgi:hypothetical protein